MNPSVSYENAVCSRCERVLASAIAVGALFMFGVALPAVDAAAPTISHTETFSSGSAGWGWTGGVSFASGEALFAFASQPGPPTPQSASIICSNGSDGIFQGNYPEAGVRVIGFDFLSDSKAPSVLTLTLRGDGKTYQRALAPLVVEPGRWYTLAVSVKSKDRGAWVGPGDESAFAGALAAVEQVAIKVDRADASAQTYRVDNVYIDSLPAAASWLAGTNGPRVAWGPLRSNRVYSLLVSTDLVSGVWTTSQVIQASMDASEIEWTNGNTIFMRLEGTTD